jgi:O-antigen/teichoic acid export membrane protein
VLARLLFPEAFGLMALVNALLAGLAMFSDVGLAPSIVQSHRGDDPRFLYTAWTVQVARGVLLWFVACALALPVAAFYGAPELEALLPVAGLSVLIGGFNSAALLRLQRHLAVGTVTLLELAAQLTGALVMIGWASIDRSVWALVAGAIAGSAVRMLLSQALVGRFRDRLLWDRDAARELFGFGKWIFLSTILAFLVGQSDRLIFGRIVSMGLLGIYGIAAMFAAMPGQVASRLGWSVVFPAFSRTLDSERELLRVYHRVRLPFLVIGAVVVAALLATGRPLVAVLYDARYADAGWMLQILALGAWLQILEVPSGSALLALGAPRWFAAANGCKLAGIVAGVPLGFCLLGFPGAIGGYVAAETLRYATVTLGAHRRGLRSLRGDALATSALVLTAVIGLYAGTLADGDATRLAAALAAVLAIGTSGAIVVLIRQGVGRRLSETRN